MMTTTIAIDVYFDLICPWCLIGTRHLAAALQELRSLRPDVDVRVAWHSVILMPDTPASGVPFRAFYERRLGGAAAVAARQAHVREAGRSVGVDFAFERIAVFPSTLAAHRLVRYGAGHGGSHRAEALINALFSAYFTRGEDIGNRQVLVRRAADCGLDPVTVAGYLDSAEGVEPFSTEQKTHRARGISSVPGFVFNDRLAVSGAYPASALLDAMQQALWSPAPEEIACNVISRA